ncbi:mannitol dehydrogenase family protein [Novosphingobium sp. JCM 18896]|uniref:mannitol dehydrogenase family protein n=1 Tax=Novosphingobium sp. JCM 18896 TaxID=2989731 RepID=UPI0022239EDC|nr:mannitol dehydrogenase family protein [Novosphingobium sp. JCM 18896]MCW1429506.1 mannitol dehydrogenase family protein [Novosphingobium sp. JCM 18896]
MTRLSDQSLGRLAPGVTRFAYDRAAQAVGIVHFGIGAFHRAHQAWYTDLAMEAGAGTKHGRDWTIAGVSLRSAGVAEQMNPQDGLYSVTERSDAAPRARVVGSVRQVLVAPQDPAAVVALLAAPATKIASFTITEKGYGRAADGSLDPALAGEGSIYRYLAEGLAQRRAAKLPGLTLLSCDNLADNGGQLGRLLGEHVARIDADLARWIADECTFPGTMVDRIVPATTPEDVAVVEGLLGLSDAAAVVTEPFSQWVIEDRFAQGRPAWDQVGAQLVADVAPYETAKLRMLNGAHSALAYLGLGRGHVFVHEAVADPAIRPVIERLMQQEAAASLTPAPGQDLEAYAADLLARFANPSLHHRLVQIAMDGSQKIPQRWLETLAHHQRRGAESPAILTALAAWLRHLRGDNGPVDDPLSEPLQAATRSAAPGEWLDALFGAERLVSAIWTPTVSDRDFVARLL